MTVELRKNKRKEVVLKRRNVPAIDSTDLEDETPVVSIASVAIPPQSEPNFAYFKSTNKCCLKKVKRSSTDLED